MEIRTRVPGSILFVDRSTGRMLARNVRPVLPDRLGQLVRVVVVHAGRSDQVHRSHVQAFEVLGQIRVLVLRDRKRLKELVIDNKLSPGLCVVRDEDYVVRTARLGNRTGWHGSTQKRSISVAVGQHVHGASLGVVQRREIRIRQPVPLEKRSNKHLETGARRPHHNTFTLQLGNALDAGLLASDEHCHVRSQRHYRSNVVLFVPTRFTTHSEITDRRIGQRQFEFAVLDSTDVGLGPLCALGLHLPIVVALLLVQYLGNRTTDDRKCAPNRRRSHAQKLTTLGLAWPCPIIDCAVVVIVAVATWAKRHQASEETAEQAQNSAKRVLSITHRFRPLGPRQTA